MCRWCVVYLTDLTGVFSADNELTSITYTVLTTAVTGIVAGPADVELRQANPLTPATFALLQ